MTVFMMHLYYIHVSYMLRWYNMYIHKMLEFTVFKHNLPMQK